MRIVKTVEEMRELGRQWKRAGKRVGFVPTMGALHKGHEALITAARKDSDAVVLSSFVNPIQFDDPKDLVNYPRTPEKDRETAEKAGVEVFFEPSREEMYPPGFLTSANVAFLSGKLEGEFRPGHFRGVCTVVLKLLNIIQPTSAYFGWKDAQQYIILKHMATDLCLDCNFVAIPTVRDPDGLALSSRNVLLSEDQRQLALAPVRALRRCHFLIKKQGITHCGELLQAIRSTLNTAGVQTDYAVIVSRSTLEPIDMIEQGNTLVAVAIRIGNIRLIDNTRF